MIILNIFLALVWVVLTLGALIAGSYATYDFAIRSDSNDIPLLPAIGGVVWRALATLLIVSVIVGIPLQLSGL